MFLSATVHLANNGIWAESKRADVESLIRVTNSDLLVVDQNSGNNAPLWLVDYGKALLNIICE
jgi:hypothetical protein